METSCSGGNPIVSTGFSPRFRAFEPGFPRSPPSAHGGSWTSYAFLARLGELPLRKCAINKGHPAHQRREATWLLVIKSGILACLSGYLAWVYTLNSGRRARRCRARDRRRRRSARGCGRRVRLRSASAFQLRRLRSSARASVPQAPRTGRHGPFVSWSAPVLVAAPIFPRV